VSNFEVELLQSVLGSINLDQRPDALLAQLTRLEKIYKEITRKAAAYPNAAKYGFGGSAPAAPAPTAPPAGGGGTPLGGGFVLLPG